MCCLRSSIDMPELARQLRHLMVLQEPHVLGDDPLGRRAGHAEVAQLQQQAFLQVARGDADRIEALDQRQRPLDLLGRPRPHRRELLDGRHQVAVVVEVADDGLADLAHQRVVGLHRELPEQVVGERRPRRERVLDRRELLDFGRRARPVAVVEVVAEEVLVVLVVPGVALLLVGFFSSCFSWCRLDRLKLFGGHFLEHRVLDHLLVEQLRQLERRHRQELDRLLKRRRQNQLLNELGVEFLRNRHASVAENHLSPTGSRPPDKSGARPRPRPASPACRCERSRHRARCMPGR